MNHKIAIVGAGNMGGTFFKGLSSVFPKESLFICDKDQKKLDALEAENSSADPNEALKEATAVIVAVKPQAFGDLLSQLTVNLQFKLVISIMAGISMDRLMDETGSKRVIRAMPNLPVQVKEGVTGWVASEKTEDSDVELADQIFSALGSSFQVNHESMLDAFTILSGCGPAYFFYLIELLIGKARAMGFSDEEAQKITEETFLGSAKLLKKNDQSAIEWRRAVTSPGGVTEAVIDSLKEHDFDRLFDEALEAGLKQSEELNS